MNYKRVTLTYTTHSDGGLTEKDFAGAAHASDLGGDDGGEIDRFRQASRFRQIVRRAVEDLSAEARKPM